MDSSNSHFPSEPNLSLSFLSSALNFETGKVLRNGLLELSRGVKTDVINSQSSAMEADFMEALEEGLKLCMLPHHSVKPTGLETGDFLVIDLGGLTLRVAVISIHPHSGLVDSFENDNPLELAPRLIARGSDSSVARRDRIEIVVSKKWNISNACKVVDALFFELIVSKIFETLQDQSVIALDKTIVVGVTWSFPLETCSYNSARILLMGKGYDLTPEFRGADIKEIIESTMTRLHGIKLEIGAVVNDSFAVYAAGKYLDSTTELALVLGTGFNMCYQLTSASNFHDIKRLDNEPDILFNTEMSFFGVGLVDLFSSKYDYYIDSHFGATPKFKPHLSTDPATNAIFQPCELLCSGRYIVELVRLVVVDLIKAGEIFPNQKNHSATSIPYESITGEFLSHLMDVQGTTDLVEQYFDWASGLVLESDVTKLRSVVQAIIQRSAAVVAVAVIASIRLITRCNGPFRGLEITIGYIGSVIEHLDHFRETLTKFVNLSPTLTELGISIKLRHVNDSSLVGGAIAAACSLPSHE